MNSRENSNGYSNEDSNRKKAEMGDGFDHTIASVDESLNKARTFVDEKVHEAKSAVSSAANDATTMISKAVDQTISSVTDGIEVGKQYIADQHLEKIADDFSGIIKRYPVQSLLAGIGMGILIGNTLSRR